MSSVRVQLKIKGHVQGVFYRQSTKEVAVRLGLTGWVKNCADGSVEALLEGKQESVDTMIEWCRQGPSAARVAEVAVNRLSYENKCTDFTIRS